MLAVSLLQLVPLLVAHAQLLSVMQDAAVQAPIASSTKINLDEGTLLAIITQAAGNGAVELAEVTWQVMMASITGGHSAHAQPRQVVELHHWLMTCSCVCSGWSYQCYDMDFHIFVNSCRGGEHALQALLQHALVAVTPQCCPLHSCLQHGLARGELHIVHS